MLLALMAEAGHVYLMLAVTAMAEHLAAATVLGLPHTNRLLLDGAGVVRHWHVLRNDGEMRLLLFEKAPVVWLAMWRAFPVQLDVVVELVGEVATVAQHTIGGFGRFLLFDIVEGFDR